MRSGILTGLFLPTDVPSKPVRSAVWRYAPMVENERSRIVQGFFDGTGVAQDRIGNVICMNDREKGVFTTMSRHSLASMGQRPPHS